jgi:hypothetical protein
VALKIRNQLITEIVEQHINIKAACQMMDMQPVQKIWTLCNQTPQFIMCSYFHIKNKLFLTNYILCWTTSITTINLTVRHLTILLFTHTNLQTLHPKMNLLQLAQCVSTCHSNPLCQNSIQWLNIESVQCWKLNEKNIMCTVKTSEQ